MKRLTHVVLMGVLVLAMASLAAAQGVHQEIPAGVTPQPALRMGNYIEVGNDVFMHIIATGDFRYNTAQNFDFEGRVRDRVPSRNPSDSREQGGESDEMWMLLRFGVDFRYQKSLTLQLVGEQRSTLDGNMTDDRSNSSSPGNTSVFGTAATSENPGYHFKYAWIDYKFIGTPLRLRVGFDLWTLDQAGYIGDNDPRIAVFGEFGDIDVMAAAVLQYSGQRLGLQNDNDAWYYTFSVGYNMKPHRFQFDVVYFHDRFSGADTSFPRSISSPIGFEGQKTDSVLLMTSWSGRFGPVRGMVQFSGVTGTAHGGNQIDLIQKGLNGIVAPDRKYDILAGSVIAYGEADLGIARPFLGFLFATADGDPTDKHLHGFNPYAWNTTLRIDGTPWFSHMETSNASAARDYACPGRAQGLGGAQGGAPTFNSAAPISATNNPGAPGIPGRTAGTINPYNVGISALGGQTTAGSFSECTHTVDSPFNDLLGRTSHLGIFTPYSNPGTLLVPAGVRAFPLKGHELSAWYIYRSMVNAKLLTVAFAPELAARHMNSIGTAEEHELGGAWTWTLNPNFDIRLLGNIAFAAGGFHDLANIANCNYNGSGPYQTSVPCRGDQPALRAEARF